MACGGRAYGYIAARDAASGEREVHPEQAETVRRILQWNAKRHRGWVATAIHGDRKRGTGIWNNRAYIGQLLWGRSAWKRSAADPKQRKWQLSEAGQIVTHQDERLRMIPQELRDAVPRILAVSCRAATPGVFAMGDVLSRALKKAASAVGEGSVVI